MSLLKYRRWIESALLVFFVLALAGCSGMNYVDVTSTNQNSRINYLVIHATSADFAESLRLLSTRNPNPVSAHYLVPYLEDSSYSQRNLRIYRLVEEERRAWHAGISQWGSEVSLNNRSIGIEVVNNFKCDELAINEETESMIEMDCQFPAYPASQIEILVELIEEILARHPEIDPIDVVAHSDIAPNRKSDPGPNFPWEELYQRGIGTWYDQDTVLQYTLEFERQQPSIHQLQCALGLYGYPIEVSGVHDLQSQFAFRAFQLHYRPGDYSGVIDTETAAILYSLLGKYRGNSVRGCEELQSS